MANSVLNMRKRAGQVLKLQVASPLLLKKSSNNSGTFPLCKLWIALKFLLGKTYSISVFALI